MPIWTPQHIATQAPMQVSTPSRVTTITLHANGLLPKSSYTFWCNGIDMTWACRTPGSKMGSGLITDQSGTMTIYFSVEMPRDSTRATSGTNAKYHSMQLKDINGIVQSLSLVQQNLVGK
jgi:hypothetical protein